MYDESGVAGVEMKLGWGEACVCGTGDGRTGEKYEYGERISHFLPHLLVHSSSTAIGAIFIFLIAFSTNFQSPPDETVIKMVA